MQVNIHEAKTHLSKLIERMLAGEEVIIAKAGKPLARLMPAEQPAKHLIIGDMDGQFTIPADFDDPMPEEWFGPDNKFDDVLPLLKRPD
jgi:prevent-host-death family protein